MKSMIHQSSDQWSKIAKSLLMNRLHQKGNLTNGVNNYNFDTYFRTSFTETKWENFYVLRIFCDLSIGICLSLVKFIHRHSIQ